MRTIDERTILVTGATDGLGRALATDLARRGAMVLLHGRDDERGARTMAQIRAETGSNRLRWYRADLASLGQVRVLAQRLLAEERRLDTLVNNAGIGTTLPGGGRRQVSEDGHELRFAVNYLAPFLLTRLLRPVLVRSAPSRIVNVSSAGQAPIDFSDVMLERRYDAVQAYCQSKLAQVMFTFDEADELLGSEVTANCLHPASYMPTKIVLAARATAVSTIDQGVHATARLTVAPELERITGRYFDGVREARAHEQAYDPDARARLRTLSEQLTGLQSAATR